MWMNLGIAIIASGIFITEAPALLKKGSIKEFRVFLFLLLFATSLSIAVNLKVAVPSPIDWIEFVYKPIIDWLQATLK